MSSKNVEKFNKKNFTDKSRKLNNIKDDSIKEDSNIFLNDNIKKKKWDKKNRKDLFKKNFNENLSNVGENKKFTKIEENSNDVKKDNKSVKEDVKNISTNGDLKDNLKKEDFKKDSIEKICNNLTKNFTNDSIKNNDITNNKNNDQVNNKNLKKKKDNSEIRKKFKKSESIDFNDINEASKNKTIIPILKETPQYSSDVIDPIHQANPSKVSFDENVIVSPIKFNNGIPKHLVKNQYEIRDNKIILNNSLKKLGQKAKNYLSSISNKSSLILKYKNPYKLNSDLKLMGLKEKDYIENKVVVSGIGFRETEDSVSEYFSNFGKVLKVKLDKNTSGFCTGRGAITFSTNFNRDQQFILNNKILRIESIKKVKRNCTRLYISHMSKEINISKLRQILKDNGFVAKNIRIDLQQSINNGKNNDLKKKDLKKNLGFGFVEFGCPEHAERFLENFKFISKYIGPNSFAEFSKEKNK